MFVHLLCSPAGHLVHMRLVLLLHTLQRWFVHTLEVAVQNSWLLYKRSDAYTTEPLDLLNFRRQIVKVYLMRNALPMPTALALAVVQHIPDNVRFDGICHFNVASQSNQRCRVCKVKCKIYHLMLMMLILYE